jgi:hypothetical protein
VVCLSFVQHQTEFSSVSGVILRCYTNYTGARGDVVVKALRYKSAGRGFDSRWCHFLNKFELDPVAPIFTGITSDFNFHMR